jgi:hypothetical protein
MRLYIVTYGEYDDNSWEVVTGPENADLDDLRQAFFEEFGFLTPKTKQLYSNYSNNWSKACKRAWEVDPKACSLGEVFVAWLCSKHGFQYADEKYITTFDF